MTASNEYLAKLEDFRRYLLTLTDKQVWGMGCLAAALIKELKDGPGGTYIVPKGDEAEYNYMVRGSTFSECPLTISCMGHESTRPLSPAEFLKWCEKQS